MKEKLYDCMPLIADKARKHGISRTAISKAFGILPKNIDRYFEGTTKHYFTEKEIADVSFYFRIPKEELMKNVAKEENRGRKVEWSLSTTVRKVEEKPLEPIKKTEQQKAEEQKKFELEHVEQLKPFRDQLDKANDQISELRKRKNELEAFANKQGNVIAEKEQKIEFLEKAVEDYKQAYLNLLKKHHEANTASEKEIEAKYARYRDTLLEVFMENWEKNHTKKPV